MRFGAAVWLPAQGHAPIMSPVDFIQPAEAIEFATCLMLGGVLLAKRRSIRLDLPRPLWELWEL